MKQLGRTAFIPAPRPRDDKPSKFITECLGLMTPGQEGRVALDLGAGYGRHARALAKLGFWVLALDLDEAASAASANTPGSTGVVPVVANLKHGLPCRAGSIDLAMSVNFPIEDKLPAIDAALKVGGLLIYETPGGQGQNWQELPKAGQLPQALESEYELLIYGERPVGPPSSYAVVVHLLARRR